MSGDVDAAWERFAADLTIWHRAEGDDNCSSDIAAEYARLAEVERAEAP